MDNRQEITATIGGLYMELQFVSKGSEEYNPIVRITDVMDHKNGEAT